ncbi:hypothetical protein Tco_0045788 [Tanacetum coccineum]
MDTTGTQQKALDDDLVALANHTLKLTSFYKAFEITADVPEIYMQEFWVTASRHHSSLCFKMNGKSHTVNVDNFRDMLQICPKLLRQKFEDPPFKEEILSFVRDIGHTSEIKCLSGKTIALGSLCLSRAQILWGMYHNKNVDYVYLLWEDLVYQVENKNSKKNNDMCYPRFTKVIVDYFMAKDYDEEDDDEVSMSNDNDDNADDEDDDGQDDDNERTESDNDGDDFVHPKFSTHDEEDRQDEEENEEDSFDLRVQTNSHVESTNDEAYDDATQGGKDEGEELGKEEINEEEEVNELYRDVNVNLERRDTKMIDANVQATQVIEDTHVIITAVTPEAQQQSSSVSSGFISNMLNPNPDIGINSILNPNTESTSLVDVPVTTNADMSPSSATTLPSPLIQPLLQTPVSTLTIVPSASIQNLPTFDSVFKFEDKIKALEDDFLEFKQTNQLAKVVSSIPSIIDTYLANKMNKAIKATVQLQSDRLRDEAQAKNKDFINKLDENIKKIIKEQVKIQVSKKVSKILPRIEQSVSDLLEAEVLIRSSNEAKTSHAVEANLSEIEMKKILIDKMENNKSIDRSVQQKNLYRALVDAYEADKDILDTYGDTVTLKRRQDDEDEDEEPSAGSNWGSKRRRAGKQLESTSAPKEKTSKPTGKSKEGSKSLQAEEPTHTVDDLEEPTHQEFDTGFTEDQPVDDTAQLPDWF